MRSMDRVLIAVLAGLVLAGCASGSRITRGGGQTLAEAIAEPADGTKYRIAVGAVIDKTRGKYSVVRQVARMNAKRAEAVTQLTPEAITLGVRDMLVTELFGSKRFIVLEREALDSVLAEQEFSHKARAGDQTRIPLGELEGAELMVLGAITAFDAGVSGGSLPIPFKFGDDDVGVMNLAYARGKVVMDLRIIDVRSGRVVTSVAVEGTNSRFGVDVDAYVNTGGWQISLPGALNYFHNTPVEKALQEMVSAAVTHIVKRTKAARAV
jgi:curli biogenesis system outer membrane secretion channel CsgG